MTETKRLDFRLTAPQSKALRLIQRPKTDINLEWGRGNGKSWFSRFVAWLWAAQADGLTRLELLEKLGVADQLTAYQRNMATKVGGVRVVFLMPTFKQFRDVHSAHIESEVAEWGHLSPDLNKTSWKISFPGGSWIQPFPASDHGSQRARGIRCDIVICDEADDIDPGVFDAVVRPWFSEPWSLKIRITGGTYKRGRHGLLWKRRIAGLDESKPRYHTLRATYLDCPEIVDINEVEDARANTSPEIFESEWMCNPDAGRGLVYNFNEDFHVQEAPTDIVWSEMLIGCDHGHEDAGVLVLIGVIGSGRDARVWVLDEIYETKCLEDWWVERVADWVRKYPNHRFYGDPSQPARLAAFKRVGARLESVDNSIEDGVSCVANMLAIRELENGERFSRMYVQKRCVNVRREFGLYRRKRDPKNQEGYLDDIVDRDNHGMDAIRYPIFNRLGSQIGQNARGFSRYDDR